MVPRLSFLSTFGVWFLNEFLRPRTINGFSCAGMFPSCGQPNFCIEVPPGVRDAGIPNVTEQGWKRCDASTRYKLRGPVCVVDEALYRRSNRRLGYDFCVAGFEPG